MFLRPQRNERHKYIVFIHGNSGISKTEAVRRVLEGLKATNKEYDYYCKMSGFSKWWEGYDNQPITWIDEIGLASEYNAGQIALQVKSLFLNKNPQRVEVKGKSLNFDFKLVIMCSNYTVEEVVSSMKDQDQEAVKRRFTSYCYLENVNTVKKRKSLYMSLMQIVADNFDVNLKELIHNM